MENELVYYMIPLLIAMVVGIVVFLRFNNKSNKRDWLKLTKSLGLTLNNVKESPNLTGRFNDMGIHIYTEKRVEGSRGDSYGISSFMGGYTSQPYTVIYHIIVIQFEKTLSEKLQELNLNLYEENLAVPLGKIFGQYIKLGWKELDDLVIIKGNDESQIKDLLLKDGVKEKVKEIFTCHRSIYKSDRQIPEETISLTPTSLTQYLPLKPIVFIDSLGIHLEYPGSFLKSPKQLTQMLNQITKTANEITTYMLKL